MRSAVPPNSRSGNAARKPVMKRLMSSRPRRGACNEYCSSMSGAASSSMTARLQGLPQNSLNQRPTTALFSSSFDIVRLLEVVVASNANLRSVTTRRYPRAASNSVERARALVAIGPAHVGRQGDGDLAVASVARRGAELEGLEPLTADLDVVDRLHALIAALEH